VEGAWETAAASPGAAVFLWTVSAKTPRVPWAPLVFLRAGASWRPSGSVGLGQLIHIPLGFCGHITSLRDMSAPESRKRYAQALHGTLLDQLVWAN
jgi:hypothetical protein